jgi:hypothetical protein
MRMARWKTNGGEHSRISIQHNMLILPSAVRKFQMRDRCKKKAALKDPIYCCGLAKGPKQVSNLQPQNDILLIVALGPGNC